MGKKDVVHVHTGTLFSHKKGRSLPVTTWMGLARIMLHGVSQKEKAMCCQISLIRKIKTSLTCKAQYNSGYQRVCGGRDKRDGVSKYKLVMSSKQATEM